MKHEYWWMLAIQVGFFASWGASILVIRAIRGPVKKKKTVKERIK